MREIGKEEMKEKKNEKHKQKNEKVAVEITSEREDGEKVEKEKVKPYVPTLPFPQRFVAHKLNEKFAQFLEFMKSVDVNIPFLKAIAEMPAFAKFLKYVLQQKGKLEDVSIVHLPENVTAIVQRRMSEKKPDPGSFVIPIKVGNLPIKRALTDLGAGVSLMPLSIAIHLEQEIKPSKRVIHLADRTVRMPVGELYDVPVQIGNFFIPCDFIVMDMEEDPHTPLILGRPFTATSKMVFNCEKNTLTLKVDDEEMVFGFSNGSRSSTMVEVGKVDVVEENKDEKGKEQVIKFVSHNGDAKKKEPCEGNKVGAWVRKDLPRRARVATFLESNTVRCVELKDVKQSATWEAPQGPLPLSFSFFLLDISFLPSPISVVH